MTTRGLSERRALAVTGMSASALRYAPRPDRNVAQRQKILALAHRYRRYGVGMIHLKLRQSGEKANHKRVERLYRDARLYPIGGGTREIMNEIISKTEGY